MQDKKKILSYLYELKAFGYNYIEPLTLNKSISVKLPDEVKSLREMVLNCHLCDLSKSRKNVIFGEGNNDAKVMFIGEVPGSTEDDTGRPFVGRSGELLTKMIENVLHVKRTDVYITYIIKCKSPNNRLPNIHEVEVCQPYILKEIELINPDIIVALGEVSYKYLTGDTTSLSKIRGEVISFQNKKLIATFHPSFLLRNVSSKKEAFSDMLLVKQLLDDL